MIVYTEAYLDLMEADDRRTFLKKSASALLSGRSLLNATSQAFTSAATTFAPQIAAFASSGLTKDEVSDILFDLVNGHADVDQDMNVNSSLLGRVIPKDVITGALADAMSKDSNAFVYNLTGDNPGIFDQYDGVLSHFCKQAYEKLGPANFVRTIIQTLNGTDEKGFLNFDDESRYALETLGDLFPDISIPLDLSGDEFDNIKQLKQNGYINQEEFNHMMQKERLVQIERDRSSKEYEQAKKRRPEPLEKYNAPKDYEWASPMHQPFESRLLKALNTIK